MCCAYSDDIIPNVWNWKQLPRGHLKQSLTLKALVYIPLPILALIIGPSQCPCVGLTLRQTWSSCFQQRNVKSFSLFKQGQSLAVKARRHETNTPAGVWDRGRRWRGPRSARCRASRSKAHLYHLNADFHPQQPRKHHPPSEFSLSWLVSMSKGQAGWDLRGSY